MILGRFHLTRFPLLFLIKQEAYEITLKYYIKLEGKPAAGLFCFIFVPCDEMGRMDKWAFQRLISISRDLFYFFLKSTREKLNKLNKTFK